MSPFRYFEIFKRPAVLGITLVVLVSLLGVERSSFADKAGCLRDPAFRPCGGAEGTCVMNPDGTQGGFVANTARLKTQKLLFGLLFTVAKPFIGIDAQVCGHSQIGPHVRIDGKAIVNDSILSGNVWVDGQARIVQSSLNGNVRVGGTGSRIEESALSGNIKVSENAKIGNSNIRGKVKVYDDAVIVGSTVWGPQSEFGNLGGESGIEIHGNASIGDSRIRDNVDIRDNVFVRFSTIKDRARISGKTSISAHSLVAGDSIISGDTHIISSNLYVKAQVFGKAIVTGSDLTDNAQVFDNAQVKDSFVSENVQLFGNGRAERAQLSGNVRIYDQGVAYGKLSGDLHITEPMPIPQPDRIFTENNEPFIGPLNHCITQQQNFLESFRKSSGLEETFQLLRELSQTGRFKGKEKSQIQVLVDYFCNEPNHGCPVCLEPITSGATLGPCEHLICRSCFSAIKTGQSQDPRCPYCRKTFDLYKILSVIQAEPAAME